MATKSPAERAIADVEKAIKDTDKAHEKYDNLQSKADEALEAAKRTEKELRWRANHPDLPDDFDLDEFRRSLAAPFDEPDTVRETGEEIPVEALEEKAEAVGDAIESGAIDPDALEDGEPFTEPSEAAVSQGDAIDVAENAIDDDPWGED